MYLKDARLDLFKLVRTSTNPKILKGAVIGLIFYVEKLTRDIDRIEGEKRRSHLENLAKEAREINMVFCELLGKRRKKLEVDEILGALLSVGINFTDEDYQPSLFTITVYKLVKNAYDYISEGGQTSIKVEKNKLEIEETGGELA